MKRKELLAVTNEWLEALVRRAPSQAPVSSNCVFTENGQPMDIGQGLWQTARGISYRRTYVDAQNHQAAFFGVVLEEHEENYSQVIYVLRIKASDGLIVEAETLAARKGCHPLFAPDRIEDRPVLMNLVPSEERVSRQEMVLIADSYFEAIEQADANIVPLHPDCDRRENGFLTTNNPPRLPLSTAAGIPRLSYIKAVEARRYPVVDVARGIVVGIVRFDVPGEKVDTDSPSLEQTLRAEPRSLFLYEIFKIEDGLIRDIEAFMMNAPLQASMGWASSS